MMVSLNKLMNNDLTKNEYIKTYYYSNGGVRHISIYDSTYQSKEYKDFSEDGKLIKHWTNSENENQKNR